MRRREEFDVEAEFVDGHNLTSGERFQGYNVRYRAAGTKGRWTRFLLVPDPPGQGPPTLEQLHELCLRHRELAREGVLAGVPGPKAA